MTKKEKVGLYFEKESSLEFISSGCQLLDKVLGGGYALGRVTNVVGDKSTGKTLLSVLTFSSSCFGLPMNIDLIY